MAGVKTVHLANKRAAQHLSALPSSRAQIFSVRSAKRESRETSRPRNSFGPSCRPPHDERRRVGASVVAGLGEGAAHPVNACVRGGGESGRPIIGASLPDLWLMIVGSWRSMRAPRGTSPSRRPSSRQHIKHRAANCVGEDREGLAFAVLLLNPRQDLFAVLRMAQEQHGGLGERPFQMHIAHLRAASAEFLARGLMDAFAQPRVGGKFLHATLQHRSTADLAGGRRRSRSFSFREISRTRAPSLTARAR
jgi:hypothetical protein